MRDSASSPLQKISRAIAKETVSGKQAANFFEQSIEYLLTLGGDLTDETKIELNAYVIILEKLVLLTASVVPECFYYQSVLAYIKGNFKLYYKKIEQFFSANDAYYDWNKARKYFFYVRDYMPTLSQENLPTDTEFYGFLSDRAVQYCPQSVLGLYCKSLCLRDTPQEELKLLQEVLEKDSGWPFAWMDQGRIYSYQGDLTHALEAYERALEIIGEKSIYSADIFFETALILDSLDDIDNAIKRYEKCLAINPVYKYAHNNLGVCLQERKHFAEAEKHFNLELARDKTDALTWENLGDCYCCQKEWESAFEAYRQAEKNQDVVSAGLFFQEAWCADKKRDLDSAVYYYKKCIEQDASYAFAQNNLGYCLYKQKKYTEAVDYLKYAVVHDEDKRYACRNLFHVLEKLHRVEEMLSIVRKYPKYFKTKEYRKQLEEYLPEGEVDSMIKELQLGEAEVSQELLMADEMGDSQSDAEINVRDSLQVQLEGKTENDFAGIIMVSQERSNIMLYQHQTDAINCLNEWKKRKENGAGLLVLPTGGGKTLTAVYWLMQDILDQGGRVLWIAHRHELLEQALQGFRRVCYRDLSLHKDTYSYRIISGQHDKSVHIQPGDDILIASKSSLTRNLSYLQKNWVEKNQNRICMVIDEAHHAPAGEYRKLINLLREYGGNFRLLGLTATPFRTAEKEQGLLKKLFCDDILYKIDLRTLIERGILAEPVFHSIETEINMAELFREGDADAVLQHIMKERSFDFDSPGDLSKQAARLIAGHSRRNRLIVDTYVENQQKYGKTIVFAVNVDMAIVLNTLFQERGIRSEYIVSNVHDAVKGINRSKEDNKEALRRFRADELDVLVNVNIMTEGTDLPKVQSVFLARPTKSKILMTQMIGRALRGEKAGGTVKAYIVSFLDEWQEQIAWVNPEKLYIDTNADFEEQTPDSRKYAMRLVSIAKLEEFAKLANDTLDRGITEGFSFLERIPVGLYQFAYLQDGEEESRSCTILVYDCMKKAYEQLMQWLEHMDSESLDDLDALAAHADQTLFSVHDQLLGYQYQDIYDILAYYRQSNVLPQWIPLAERKEYDIAALARNILEHKYNRWEEDEYVTSEWNRADGKWAAFFGYQNVNAFTSAIDQECRRLVHPERYQHPKELPITQMEEIQIQNLPLEEIRRRYPEIGEKLRNAVFEKYQDAEGYYFSADSGYRSKNRLDFQIDHIKPMSQGGLTCLDNLQLLTRYENAVKNDRFAEDSASRQ